MVFRPASWGHFLSALSYKFWQFHFCFKNVFSWKWQFRDTTVISRSASWRLFWRLFACCEIARQIYIRCGKENAAWARKVPFKNSWSHGGFCRPKKSLKILVSISISLFFAIFSKRTQFWSKANRPVPSAFVLTSAATIAVGKHLTKKIHLENVNLLFRFSVRKKGLVWKLKNSVWYGGFGTFQKGTNLPVPGDFEMALFRSGADFVAIYQIEFRHAFLKSGKRLAKGSLFGTADSP